MSPKNNQYAIKAWRGAALGLLAAAVLSILWAAYLVFITPPRVVSFMISSIEFIAIAGVVAAVVGGCLTNVSYVAMGVNQTELLSRISSLQIAI